MKINRVSDRAENPELGPSPAVPTAGLSPAVSAVLEHLSGQVEPVSIGALSAMTGLHGNTVREHLESLIAAGFATKEREESQGRGRPAWLYTATTESGATASPEYAGLASALAAQIHRTSDAPQEDGITAGLDWGRQLAADFERDEPNPSSSPNPSPNPRQSASSARDETVSLLAELGFAPATTETGEREASDDEAGEHKVAVRLTRCPLLSAAHQYPDIVCGVHLGLVRGALEAFGDGDTDSQLEPFVEPGACRLHLHSRKPR